MQRSLASVSNQVFFLPGHDIVRQMDLVTNIIVVHRGKVSIHQDGKKLVILTKVGVIETFIFMCKPIIKKLKHTTEWYSQSEAEDTKQAM